MQVQTTGARRGEQSQGKGEEVKGDEGREGGRVGGREPCGSFEDATRGVQPCPWW